MSPILDGLGRLRGVWWPKIPAALAVLAAFLLAVEKIHETLHREGTVRLLSNLKLETRTDKTPTLAGKRL